MTRTGRERRFAKGIAIAFAVAIGHAFTAPAIAAEATPQAGAMQPSGSCGHRDPGDTRPRIGLALGGGGARGTRHAFALRAGGRGHRGHGGGIDAGVGLRPGVAGLVVGGLLFGRLSLRRIGRRLRLRRRVQREGGDGEEKDGAHGMFSYRQKRNA